MTEQTLMDDIRSLVEPAAYLQNLQKAKSYIKEQMAAFLVDVDLVTNNPEVPEANKQMLLEQADTNLKDLKWRLAEIERRITAHTEAQEKVKEAPTPIR